MSYQNLISASIVVGNSTTNPIQLNELSAVGLMTDGNQTSTTFTFLVSPNNVTYYPLYLTDGFNTAEYTITAGSVTRAFTLDPASFYPWNFVKVRLGTSASPVNQVSANTVLSINAKLI